MAQDISGDWRGVFTKGYQRIGAVFQFERAADGYAGTINLRNSPTGPVALTVRETEQGRLILICAVHDLSLDLARDPEGRLTGIWRHEGGGFPIVLERGGAPALRPPRPQTPRGAFAYIEEAVTFIGGADDRLAGVLTRPSGAPAAPAVVLAQMYGCPDRDQTAAGHKPFAVWADRLTRGGFAVLRFDKRGVGASAGDHANADTRDFADDVAAAVVWLRARPDIDPARVGLLGHSEGGLQAAMVAADDPSIAFCVCLVPSGLGGAAGFLVQAHTAPGAEDWTPAQIENSLEVERQVCEAIRAAPDQAEAETRINAILLSPIADGRFSPERARAQAVALSTRWSRFWMTYDPASTFRALQCPVLAVMGSKDRQTPVADNKPVIQAALANNPAAEVVVLEGLNHLLQTASTGVPAEYGAIDETIAPQAQDLVAAWIARRSAR